MTKAFPPTLRKRALSEEEKALWHEVAKSARPLRRRKRIIPDDDRCEPIETATAAPIEVKQLRRPAVPAAKQPPPLAPLGRRERSQIAKGRKPIDAKLDLHGMTQARAHRTLIAFLQRAHRDGAIFVLIITGKGRAPASESERGILRRQVPLWLGLPDLRNLVVGFEEAHVGHGGEGALYVRLRRAR
jgi:DNA-nicking Smr family endonuclease